jgi:transcription elongation factor Elf1
MDNLLHFNGKNIKVTQPNVQHKILYFGPWKFTCPHCGGANTFDCGGMIFRSIDFYCNSCGTLHRVTNPAFSK